MFPFGQIKKPTKLHDLFYMPNRLTNNHCQFKDIRRTVYGLFFQKHAFYIENINEKLLQPQIIL